MRRSISGREIEFEIPLLVALFYLFCGVETEARLAVPSLLALNPGLLSGAIYAEDNVRWGVWLGRHIC